MRVTVGMIGLLGLGFTVAAASAQTPGAPRRGATLLPPVAIHPSELPAVVRAAPEDVPINPGMTPITRSARTAPGWINGTDPNVQPATATTQPQPATKSDPSLMSRSFDKLRNAFSPDQRNDLLQKSQGKLPPGVAAVGGQPNANTPFRGTANNGAPVYAGPPAYRWYGWGSVTPGANPYAPTGEHPPASAAWFSITGATPGAFPVPVMNPPRPSPGAEPPAYVNAPNRRVVPATYPTTQPAMPTSRGMSPSETVAHAPPSADPSNVAPQDTARPTPPPTTSTPPPTTMPPTVAIPTLTPPPGTTSTEPPIAPAQPAASETKTVEPATVTIPPIPAALPTSVTDDPLNWQPRTTPGSGGEWGPSGGIPLRPTTTTPTPTPQPQSGANSTVTGQPIARGQIAESRPDATVGLVRQLCANRATGVDVRWTGSNKLTVTFTCRTAADARQLAKDISARPELAPLQIDFSVSVK